MISMDKTYTTRDGNKVRLYALDGGGNYPVHGAFFYNDAWCAQSWTEKGRLSMFDTEDEDDLIEAPITRQMWVNVYPEGAGMWNTKEKADSTASKTRIACVPVTITYRPGEGLDNNK